MERQVTTWVCSTEGCVNLSTRVDRDCGAGTSFVCALQLVASNYEKHDEIEIQELHKYKAVSVRFS